MQSLVFFTIPGILLAWIGISLLILRKDIEIPWALSEHSRRLVRRTLEL